MAKRADKSAFFEWFYHNADFGPADGDVRNDMKRAFVHETGLMLPMGFWDEESDGGSEPTPREPRS